MTERAIVAEFHKDSGGRLKLWQITTIEDKGKYLSKHIYDVEWSKRFGYIYDMSGFGGDPRRVTVDGIYFASGEVEIDEKPCTLVDPRDKPPWRGKKTKAIRARNKTRRLRRLPPAFDLESGHDLLDWLQRNAIEEHAVYCSICRDFLPATGFDYCKHVWWCDKTCWYSTPSERCKCNNRDECEDAQPPEPRIDAATGGMLEVAR